MSNLPLAAALPTNCPAGPSYAVAPYYYATGYADGGSTSTTVVGSNWTSSAAPGTANTYQSSTWNLIDGYLRVEYSPGGGAAFVPVTMEWLQLGFARGPMPPTAPGTNPINPNAILLLQEPADRLTAVPTTPPQICTGTAAACATLALTTPLLSTGATAPVCTATTGSGAATRCTAWASAPPQLLTDSTNTAPTMNWVYGVTSSTVPSTPATSKLKLQSPTRFNWYPINFYDVREGEVRDNTVADNSCSTNGLMNTVEIDVGNLNRWLTATTGSGSSVDFSSQNGYILYFSDRRGMLLNPHPPLGGAPTKTGDAGTEDVINRSSGPGTPDGALEAPVARSSEDDNENGFLDNFGPGNMGLGFYGTVASPGTAAIPGTPAVSGKNLNTQINSGTPDPFGTDAAGDTANRIASCTLARKNWVSGARHVLRLVDGSLGNVPRRTDAAATLDAPGGFTVASENPVYVWGDYNTNAADAVTNAPNWAADTAKFQGDVTGHSAAAVIADAVTLLSVDWNDLNSTVGSAGSSNQVTDQSNRNPSHDGHFRLAIAGGKNINFPQPTYSTPGAPSQDFGTDGGVHNFLRYLENWGGQTMYYKGSLVSLFYATYNTGTFKCCTDVYGVPTRAFYFDLDFTSPGGLPPGTPMFRDVETLTYRQLFVARTTGQ